MRADTIERVADAIASARSALPTGWRQPDPKDQVRSVVFGFLLGFCPTAIVGVMVVIAVITSNPAVAVCVLLATPLASLATGIWGAVRFRRAYNVSRVRPAIAFVRAAIEAENASVDEVAAASRRVRFVVDDWRLPGVERALQQRARHT